MKEKVKKSLGNATTKKEIRSALKRELFKGMVEKPLTHEKFKSYVTDIFALDDFQTKTKNRTRGSVKNEYLKDNERFPEIESLRRIQNQKHGESKENIKKKLAKLEKELLVEEITLRSKALGKDVDVDISNVESFINETTNEEYDLDILAQTYEMVEPLRVKQVKKYMEDNLPVYQWCKEVRGLGDKLTAKLLAGIGDIKRFPNPASLWSYCGVGDASTEKRVTGQLLTHSPKMRSTLFNLQESFIKANSQYRVIYDKRKEKTLKTRPEWHNLVPCPIKNVGKDAPKTDDKGKVTWANKHPKHAHIDASRVMIKRFLCELFVAWYMSLGIEPPAKPYGVEIQGHHEDPMIVPYVGTRHIIDLTSKMNNDNE